MEIIAEVSQKIGLREYLEDAADTRRLTSAGGLDLFIALVADGIGGEKAGERAARITIETVIQSLRASTGSDIPRMMKTAIEEANQKVCSEMRIYQAQEDMGCTVTLAVVHHTQLYLANVGDSRAYLIRGGTVQQLTVDHTWGNEMLRQGKRTLQEMTDHPGRDKLTRSIGYDPTIRVDLGIYTSNGLSESKASENQGMRLKPGDRVLLCSDGLIKRRTQKPGHFVEPAEMTRIFNAYPAKKAVEELVKLAVSRQITITDPHTNKTFQDGDNVSAVLMQMPGGVSPLAQNAAQARLLFTRHPKMISLAAILSVFLVILTGFIFTSGGLGGERHIPTPTIPPLASNFAYVSAMAGDVSSRQGSGSYQLVNAGDTISAGANTGIRVMGEGFLRLGLADGTLLFLGPDSEIGLLQIAGEASGIRETVINLKKGVLLIFTQANSAYNVVVNSPDNIRAEARSAIFGAAVENEGNVLRVDCLDGVTKVFNTRGKSVNLKKGQAIEIANLGAFSDPLFADYDRYAGLGDKGTIPTATATKEPTATRTITATPTSTATRVYQPPQVVATKTEEPDQPQNPPTSTFPAVPTSPVPTTPVPTRPPALTHTAEPPTATDTQTGGGKKTKTPASTDTPAPPPTDTFTPVPPDTDTPVPPDTDTPVPPDTNTPEPPPTDTTTP